MKWNASDARERGLLLTEETQLLTLFISAVENDIMSCKPRPIRNNLSRKERKALTTLRKRTDVVISRQFLFDYKVINSALDNLLVSGSEIFVDVESNKNCRLLLQISLSQLLELHVFTFYQKFTNLTTQADLVSACSCPTELISSYLDKIMAPIVRSLPSYVKDSQHALQIFRDFNFLGKDKLIFTMDITSLYTVIPNCEGLLALRHLFDLRTVKEPSSETLVRLAELVLTLNCFSFAGSYYKQINVVAMGTKMGPSYAKLFVGYIEHQLFNQYYGPKPDLYRRYIDDCVGTTSSTREELDQFITAVTSFHPALKYTYTL